MTVNMTQQVEAVRAAPLYLDGGKGEGEEGVTRASTPGKTSEPHRESPPARVAPLGDDPRRWREFQELAEGYVAARAKEFSPDTRLGELVHKVLQQAGKTHVAMAYRGERAVGFVMMAGKMTASGRRVWWIADLYAPGDLGVSRLLCRTAELIARRFGYECVAFQSRSHVVAKVAKLAGFAPQHTIYAKEV